MRRVRLFTTLVIVAAVSLCAGCGDSAPTMRVVTTGVQRVVVDTDLDLSDIAALAVLLRDPKVDVGAITLTPNGTGPWDCTTLLRLGYWVLARLSRAGVPMACGREKPGPGALPFPESFHAGAARVWGLDLPALPAGTDPPTTAAALISQTAATGPVMLVALGPWTNLQDAIAGDQKLLPRITAVHAMAGAVDVDGNVEVGSVRFKDRLEWNLVSDPAAFRAVFNTRIALRLVPLDATDDVPVPRDLGARLADASAPGATLVADLLKRAPERSTAEGQQLWDELAALAITHSDVVTWKERTLRVAENTRLTVSDGGRKVTVAVEGHDDAAIAALVAALARP